MGTDARDGFGQARADGRHGMKYDNRTQDWPIRQSELDYSISQNNCSFWEGDTRAGTAWLQYEALGTQLDGRSWASGFYLRSQLRVEHFHQL